MQNALKRKKQFAFPIAENRRLVRGGEGETVYWPLSGLAERKSQ